MEKDKNIENEIDWKIIDQLHNATNNFSKNCLEIKKLLFVVIGISTPLIINLCNNKLDRSLFISLYLFIVSFWLFDSYSYYYQEKLRAKMNDRFKNISERNNDVNSVETSEEEFTLQKNRTNKKRILRSLFNMSHLVFYGILFLLVTLGFVLYNYGIIK